MNRHSFIIYILVADLLLLLVGIFSPLWFGVDQLRMLSLTTAAIGIWTFLGFFYILYGPGLVIEMAMRNAITASVISMFLVTVGIVTFFSTLTPTGTPPPQLSELTRTIVNSFQTVVTVVVGFYFTSSAIVEGIQRNRTGSIRDTGVDNEGSRS